MPESTDPAEDAGAPRVTTVAERATKAFIEPYDDAPTMRVAAGVIGCIFCTNTGFRRSRVRFHDVRELLLLRYPMRCMRCNQRQYGYFLTAALALPPRTQSARVARGQDTWKAWTDTEATNHPLQRPMTTTLGTRATKLQPPPRNTPAPTQDDHSAGREDDHHIW